MNAKSKAIQHLMKDKTLKMVIDRVGTIHHQSNTDLYLSLLRAIVSQQLSVKAADTIWKRFENLIQNVYPLPELILKLDNDQLRSVGLSYQKANYIKNIASFAIEKSLDYKQLKKMNDEALINYLTSIKGVGRWTVEMILMFSLNRLDVFPMDDLGIQNGIKSLYKLNAEKKELKKQMLEISKAWSPYRTLACKYVWRHKDDVVK